MASFELSRTVVPFGSGFMFIFTFDVTSTKAASLGFSFNSLERGKLLVDEDFHVASDALSKLKWYIFAIYLIKLSRS